MAKYISFLSTGTSKPQGLCASDAEKTAHEAVDTAINRSRTYVSVSDADFAKADEQKNYCTYDGTSITWDTVNNDGTIDLDKATIQGEIDFSVDRINTWLESSAANVVSETIKNEWIAYRDELQAIDLDTKTFPMNGTYFLADLVGDGITAWRNTDRLP